MNKTIENKAMAEEKPLHEIILDVLYCADDTKPVALTPETIFFILQDASISEKKITEVLEWLVAKRRVEKQAGKYWLDKYEFIEKANNRKNVNKLSLPEAIINILYYEDTTKPVALSSEEIFLTIQDTEINENIIQDTLEQLLANKKVVKEFEKYRLDKYEFVNCANKEKQLLKPKKSIPSAEDVLNAAEVKAKKKRIVIERPAETKERKILTEQIDNMSKKIRLLEEHCTIIEQQQKNTRMLIVVFLVFIVVIIALIGTFLLMGQ